MEPHSPSRETTDPVAKSIGDAARKLDQLRRNWLNPPDLVTLQREVVKGYPDRIVPLNDRAASQLKKRTLTDLYNERPTWLVNAHQELDKAVSIAYGWPAHITAEDVLERLLELNRARAA